MRGDDRPPLHLAPPPATGQPDARVSVALTLLGPIAPGLDDAATNALCPDGYDAARADELFSDPRYVIGRLHQALTALLADDIPPPDAIAYRERHCPQCEPEGTCAACWQPSRKADEYRACTPTSK